MVTNRWRAIVVKVLLITAVVAGVVALRVMVPWAAAVLGPMILSVVALRLLIGSLFPVNEDAERHRGIASWTFLAFLVHLSLGVLITFTPLHQYFGSDANHYHQTALQIIRHWDGLGPMPRVGPGKEGFYFYLAAIYRILGPYRISGLIINAAFGSAIIPVMARLTGRLFGTGAARYVAPLLFFLPGFVVWPSLLLREAVVLFLVSVATYAAVQLLAAESARDLLLGGASLALLFTLRAPVALMLGGGLLVAIAVGARNIVGGIGSSSAMLLVTLGLVIGVGIGYSGYRFFIENDVAALGKFQFESAKGQGSGFSYGSELRTLGQLFLRLPLAATRFLLGPFPTEVRSLRQAPALIDAVAIWLCVPLAIWGFFRATRQAGREVLVLILPAALLTALLSLAFGNYGLVVRQRSQVTLLFVPLIALGIQARKERRVSKRESLSALSKQTSR